MALGINEKDDFISRLPAISPPPKRRRIAVHDKDREENLVETTQAPKSSDHVHEVGISAENAASRVVPSPVQLNFIDELPGRANVDTISLGSILGDVMIRECWLFNYLFDVDFVM